jgi:membrane protein YqaA with SNARE-associated domain
VRPAPVDAPAATPRRPNALRRLYAWVLSWAETPYGTGALAGISFAESSFFPIPPDVLQIALSVARPRRSFFYAAVSTLASVAGGLLGWAIGQLFWESTSGFFFDFVPGFTRARFGQVQELYLGHAFVAIFSAAFTPIPYKVFTIAAGVFGVPLPVLAFASLLGRGARFFAVGACIYFLGPRVKELLDRYFEWATLALLVLAIAGFVAIKFLL